MMASGNDNFKITRYLTKKDLVEANNAALREKRSKVIQKALFENSPDDFIFVVAMEYYHNKHEMRLGISLDFKGSLGLLDVSMTRFSSLPIARQYTDGKIEFESPEETEKRRPYPDRRQWQETYIKRPLRKQGKFRETVLSLEFRVARCEHINN